MEEDILLIIKNKLAIIRLNRPKKLNVMNLNMTKKLREYLEICLRNKNIVAVLIEGEGEKAYSAGGDLLSIKDAYEKDGVEATLDILGGEYLSGNMVSNYPKLIISYMDGITMGGSAGIIMGSDIKIATERTKWAMPETKIGIFPDVALSYYFSRMQYSLGNYIALTSRTINADDCLFTGIADIKLSSENYKNWFKDLEEKLEERSWENLDKEEIKNEIIKIFKKYELARETGFLEKNKEEIQEYFSKDSLEDIYKILEEKALVSELARNISEDLKRNSPISMKVVKELLARAKNMTLKECSDLDFVLAKNFMSSKDIYEGIRSILINKDGKVPNWEIKKIENVKEDLVNSYFK